MFISSPRSSRLVPVLLAACLLASAASATTIWVPSTYPTVQAAINAAMTGDTVVVAPGTYHERLNFGGKAITVRSTDPSDWAVVASTIIDADAGGSCVRFDHGEGNNSYLRGLKLTNGSGGHLTGTTNYGGGVLCIDAGPTISNCLITGNSVDFIGGGIYCYNGGEPVISNNIIANNSAGYLGGGIGTSSYPTITGNLIVNNTATGGGGILCNYSAAIISRNTIACNTADADGGGNLMVAGSQAPTITNTIIAQAVTGGEIKVATGTPAAVLSYCDVWNAAGDEFAGMGDVTGASGNISKDPLFVDAAAGNFRLKSTGGHWNGSAWVTDLVTSPCVDRGDPLSPFANEPAPNGERINMGYDGYTPYASKSGSFYARVVETDARFWSAQDAIDAAVDGQTVELQRGTYYECINFDGKAITVRSTTPSNPATVAGTIIDGGEMGAVVTFNHSESTDSVLQGLTITNGTADYGGGVRCDYASPTIIGNTISNCHGNMYGGGLWCEGGSPVLSSNTVTGNTAEYCAGGIGLGNSGDLVVTGNTVSNNSTKYDGGGMWCQTVINAVISGNIFRNNSNSDGNGGGIFADGDTGPILITGNVFVGNQSNFSGGAISLQDSYCTASFNTCYGNGSERGGGIMGNDATVTNNIVAASTRGGGISTIGGTLSYCDVYGSVGENYYGTALGVGCFSKDALFVDAAGGDFRLKSAGGRWDGSAWVKDAVSSPCIDAGDPASEFSGEPTPNGSRANIGYDGNSRYASKPPPPVITVCAPKGTGLPVTAKVVARFNIPVKPATVQAAFYINGVHVTTGTFTWLGTKLTYTPATPWRPMKRYQCKMTTAVRSKAGVAMAEEKIWNFTTGAAAPAFVTASAAPTAAGAQITVSLASAADVTISIRNLAGREVAVLTPGQLEAGTHTLLWNGKSGAGTKAPPGMYLVEATARRDDGSSCSAVGSIRR